ncbi:MAG: alpha/beta hydrolase [Ferruginibacter sp.]
MKTVNFLLLFFFFISDTTAQDSSFTQQEIIYGRKDGMALTMIHLAPKKVNGKAILRVISGNWVSNNNRLSNYISGSQFYMEKGYSVFLVMHGSQPKYAIPDQVNDIKRAVRFIRYNAKSYGIDPGHIGINGASSGGNLSLLVATADDKMEMNSKDPVDRVSSRVQAVAVYFPPTDFFNWGVPGGALYKNEKLLSLAKVAGAFDFRVYSDSATAYLPVTDTTKRINIYRETSPIYAVTSDDPPVLIFHGDKDRTVPLQQTESILAKFKENKVPNQFVLKKDGGHGWPADISESKQIIDWFDKYLK